jgi:hypothetical protein
LIKALYGYFLCAIVLDHAHLVCPIALAWSNRGFRRTMLERPEKYILLPALALILAAVVDAGASTTRDRRFVRWR